MAGKNFWDDLDESTAEMVRLTLFGENVERVAQSMEKSADLFYKAANAGAPQQLNLKQFCKIIQKTGNYAAVKLLAEACGFVVVRKNGDIASVLREMADNFSGAQKG